MQAGVTVAFYGVRGSTPCSCASHAQIGGNTSCVVVTREGEPAIVLDVGTGLRFYGCDLAGAPFDGTMLVTHLHWDHIQGLPFFAPLLHPESTTRLIGPPETNAGFAESLGGILCPPYFPVTLDQLAGSVQIDDLWADSIQHGTATITAAPVPHTGRTNGYRIDWGDCSIAYVPDHQEPIDGGPVADSVLELADGVDLLIHDAQFTPELLAARPDWGHATPEFAVRVAREAGAARLALHHHDPLHDDDMVNAMATDAAMLDDGIEVFAAAEGMKVSL